MRLNLGYQNLVAGSDTISSTNEYTIRNNNASALSTPTTIAPDGSSTAYGYGGNTSWKLLQANTTRTDLTSGSHIYIYSVYMKPSSDLSIRSVIYPYFVNETKNAGIEFYFLDSSVTRFNKYGAVGAQLGHWRIGYTPIRDNWFYVYGVFDARNINPGGQLYFNYYPNVPFDSYTADEGMYYWRFNIQKSNLLNIDTPPIQTPLASTIDNGDYLSIDFTQLPSNIDEIENDIYENLFSTDGKIIRATTYNDKNIKTLQWDKINYTEHGYMIYNMREAVRDKAGQDCVLIYPENFKSEIDYAIIRVVDYRFTYLGLRKMASVELDYYIVSTHRY